MRPLNDVRLGGRHPAAGGFEGMEVFICRG